PFCELSENRMPWARAIAAQSLEGLAVVVRDHDASVQGEALASGAQTHRIHRLLAAPAASAQRPRCVLAALLAVDSQASRPAIDGLSSTPATDRHCVVPRGRRG